LFFQFDFYPFKQLVFEDGRSDTFNSSDQWDFVTEEVRPLFFGKALFVAEWELKFLHLHGVQHRVSGGFLCHYAFEHNVHRFFIVCHSALHDLDGAFEFD
jgi:hypothetical protein